MNEDSLQVVLRSTSSQTWTFQELGPPLGKEETVADFIFLGSKITVDSDCSHGIETCLLLARKAMTNLDSMLKTRAITLLSKVHTKSKLWFSSSRV